MIVGSAYGGGVGAFSRIVSGGGVGGGGAVCLYYFKLHIKSLDFI